MVDVVEKIKFDCSPEVFPEVHSSVNELFDYARWIQKNNQLKRDVTVDLEIERLYRIAAEHGHAKANINLQNGSMRGRFHVRSHEHLRFSQDLVDSDVATGYYLIAFFLQRGAAGLEQDEEMALRYFKKAADKGSAQAQYYLAEKLGRARTAPEVAKKMYRCAAEQGHAKAAVSLAIDLKSKGDYVGALQMFQLGASSGDESGASWLGKAFRNPPPTDELYYMGQEEDQERAERYKKIWKVLANYSYAKPKVPEIDQIVPLPPAKLPSWDGKLQWLEERLANFPPPKPDEWLIEKLAKEKGLDPATGRPMPGSPAFKAEYFPAATCESNQPCPQEGYWKVMWPESWVQNDELIQHFNEGDLMPHPEGSYYIYRVWPLPRKLVKGPMQVKWGLLG
jgi:hypothetical protein